MHFQQHAGDFEQHPKYINHFMFHNSLHQTFRLLELCPGLL